MSSAGRRTAGKRRRAGAILGGGTPRLPGKGPKGARRPVREGPRPGREGRKGGRRDEEGYPARPQEGQSRHEIGGQGIDEAQELVLRDLGRAQDRNREVRAQSQ